MQRRCGPRVARLCVNSSALALVSRKLLRTSSLGHPGRFRGEGQSCAVAEHEHRHGAEELRPRF